MLVYSILHTNIDTEDFLQKGVLEGGELGEEIRLRRRKDG
jgi:hypothetical protein